ncbi:bifunctional OB-fold nucleic acid binding domain [Babesia duncani]|uniref:asparagine--tRNA ligase n=1 Tax=Babesia duncani TaxID=323732 RepID=A0AAD9PKX5_9APIC|nr:bifunctional OB-fold nucleic acid binding domain [Babesia duncani]
MNRRVIGFVEGIFKNGRKFAIRAHVPNTSPFVCCRHGTSAANNSKSGDCCTSQFPSVSPNDVDALNLPRSIITSLLQLVGTQGHEGEATQSDGTIDGAKALEGLKLPMHVKLVGWVQNIRRIQNGDVLFLDVNDGSCNANIQVVVGKDMPNFNEIASLERGDAICTIGSLETRRGKPTDKAHANVDLYIDNANAGHELIVYKNGPREGFNPVIPSHKYTLEHLRLYPHLRARIKTLASIFRIRGRLLEFSHEFFKERKFTCTTTPLMTAVNCENMGDLFRVGASSILHVQVLPEQSADEACSDITRDASANGNSTNLSNATYLSVSGQLELEALCCAMGNVWKLGPSFRADRSDTPRHLAEFWMLEVEAINASLEDLIHLVQEYIRGCSRALLKDSMDDIEYLTNNLDEGCKSRLERLACCNVKIVTYSELVQILNNLVDKEGYSHPPINWGEALLAAHERSTIQYYEDSFVAVTHYPKAGAPFYMRMANDDTVENVDILAPRVFEIAGGSLREERYDILMQRMNECNVTGQEYQRYLDLRRFGNVPHGGFGIGFDRLVMLLTGAQNIRDVVPYFKIRARAGVN